MLIANCPKCGFPVWFGSSVDAGVTDVQCPICETTSALGICDKHDHLEWRELMLGSDEKYAQARNIFHMNIRAIAEKMELPTYLAEWRLLTEDDITFGEKGDLSKIFQEEVKCMVENILRKLNERMNS
jgi:uncharacterized Zn finger protein (UPF0148 family)